MSSIVGAITGGGGSGMAFQAQKAAVSDPVTQQQAVDQYQNANTALQQQQSFLQAVQAQNGLGNQSSVYNQLQGVASGTGPNPAQAQLAQSTGANVANQAALMAGQRGSGANTGLIARQAAQQGAATQQQSAGQAATLQANQSLNALNQMGTLATQQAQQQAAATSANTNATQGEQNAVYNQVNAQNQANIGNTQQANSANAGLASTVAGAQANLIGNLTGGSGSALAALAEGGKVPQKMANGGATNSISDITSGTQQGPASKIGQYFAQNPNMLGGNQNALGSGANQLGKGLVTGLNSLKQSIMGPDAVTGGISGQIGSAFGQGTTSGVTSDVGDMSTLAAAEGGKVPVLLSKGEKVLQPKEAKQVASGKKDIKSAGKIIPGKPDYPGNDYRNDVVKDELKPGSLVIPNKVMQSDKPHWEAMKFVHAHMRAEGLKKKPKGK